MAATDSALDKDLGLESAKSIDLSATLPGRDGPVKWSTVKVNGTGYVDLVAHYAGKSASGRTAGGACRRSKPRRHGSTFAAPADQVSRPRWSL
jgi:hypothetical protein